MDLATPETGRLRHTRWFSKPGGPFRGLLCLLILLAVWYVPPLSAQSRHRLPDGFVDLTAIAPGIIVDLRYLGNDNFIGRPIDGYLGPRFILTREAALALSAVQDDLRRFGLGLKVFDGYRPQRAVNHFIRWAKDPGDTRMKDRYYPFVDKNDLFVKGYIASRSAHSRGSTVDLTLVAFGTRGEPQELDMGTPFDFFSPRSHSRSPLVAPAQRAHRMLLQMAMQRHGFMPYHKEWWHFRLGREPFPNRYFDFPVE